MIIERRQDHARKLGQMSFEGALWVSSFVDDGGERQR